MPKDSMGRETNVNKAHKAALKMDKKIDKGTLKGQKKGVLVSARDYGFGKGLDKARETLSPKKDEASKLATKKVTRSSFAVGRKKEGKAYIDAGALMFGMKQGKVTKQIKKGEKAGLKGANKVYKAAKKITKIKSSLG